MNVGDDIAAVAERLRLVRGARGKFLRLWAIDRSMIDPLVDRLALDLMQLPPPESSAEPGAGTAGLAEEFEQVPVSHPTAPLSMKARRQGARRSGKDAWDASPRASGWSAEPRPRTSSTN